MREETTTIRINVSVKKELEQQAIIKSYEQGKLIKWTELLKKLLNKAMKDEGMLKKKPVKRVNSR